MTVLFSFLQYFTYTQTFFLDQKSNKSLHKDGHHFCDHLEACSHCEGLTAKLGSCITLTLSYSQMKFLAQVFCVNF